MIDNNLINEIQDLQEELQQAKNDIRASIINKGVSVSEEATIDSYSGFVDAIGEDSEDLFWKIATYNGLYGDYMFCKSQEQSLKLKKFDTSQIISMNHMFYSCKKLTSLDLSSFNTSNVTDMDYMFSYCERLTSLDLSNFNTSKVTVFGNMFYYCENLSVLDLSSFNTSNVTDFSYMFGGCENLSVLDLSSFNTSNGINSYGMFQNCIGLTKILGVIDLSNMKNLTHCFNSCSSLTEVHLTNICKNTISDSSGYDLDLSSTKINTECLLEIINELPDTSNRGFSRVLTLPFTNTLSQAQIKVAIDKGWQVANIAY